MAAKRRALQVLLWALFILAVNVAQGRELKPRELNANADRYDGKSVRVRGWLIIKPEGYWIFDSKAASEADSKSAKDGDCVSYFGPIGDLTRGRMEVLRGTFWKDFTKSLNMIDLGTCSTSGLDVKWQRAIDPP